MNGGGVAIHVDVERAWIAVRSSMLGVVAPEGGISSRAINLHAC